MRRNDEKKPPTSLGWGGFYFLSLAKDNILTGTRNISPKLDHHCTTATQNKDHRKKQQATPSPQIH